MSSLEEDADEELPLSSISPLLLEEAAAALAAAAAADKDPPLADTAAAAAAAAAAVASPTAAAEEEEVLLPSSLLSIWSLSEELVLDAALLLPSLFPEEADASAEDDELLPSSPSLWLS